MQVRIYCELTGNKNTILFMYFGF